MRLIVIIVLIIVIIIDNNNKCYGDETINIKYERLCNDIIKHARQAALYHRNGHINKAELEVNLAVRSFHEAKSVNPNELQAYLNIAQFFHNIHRFNDAITHWNEVIALVSYSNNQNDKRIKLFLENKKKWSRYGLASVERDKAYMNGQGNIQEALAWAQTQLDIYPNAPDVEYDLATMFLMLSEKYLNCRVFHDFEHSQQHSFNAWLQSFPLHPIINKKQQIICNDNSKLMRPNNWLNFMSNNKDILLSKQLSPYNFKMNNDKVIISGNCKWYGIIKLRNILLSGNEGLIISYEKNSCYVWISNADFQHKLHENLQIQTIWRDENQWYDAFKGQYPNHGMGIQPIVYIKRAVSIFPQFAANAFYHFVLEGLIRLIILKNVIMSDPELKIIVPNAKFVWPLIKLLPFNIKRSRLMMYKSGPPDIRYSIEEYIYSSWDTCLQTISPERWRCLEDENHNHQKYLPTVAPPSLLKELHILFSQSSILKDNSIVQDTVVFITRKGQAMRRLKDEEQLQNSIKSILPKHIKFQIFNGDQETLESSMKLFHGASIVIGVHGGGLTNIIFCKEKTLIIELGYNKPFAWHYFHIANSINMHYTHFPLEVDERGLGALDVSISQLTMKKLNIRLKQHFSINHEEL